MVAAYISGHNKNIKAYIAPILVNKRLNFNETIREIKNFQGLLTPGIPICLLVENVAYQQSAIEQLRLEGFQVDPVNPQGDDKEARLSAVAPLLKNETILFPINGTEDLEQQLVGFGIERYNDLADSFAYLAKRVQEKMMKPEPRIDFI